MTRFAACGSLDADLQGELRERLDVGHALVDLAELSRATRSVPNSSTL